MKCEFSETKGFTIIHPIGFDETGMIFPATNDDRCRAANCFTKTIDYKVKTEQLKVRCIK